MAACIVVGCIFLSRDQLLRVEKLFISPNPYFICNKEMFFCRKASEINCDLTDQNSAKVQDGRGYLISLTITLPLHFFITAYLQRPLWPMWREMYWWTMHTGTTYDYKMGIRSQPEPAEAQVHNTHQPLWAPGLHILLWEHDAPSSQY